MNIERGDVNLSPQIIIYHAQLFQENSQYVPMYQYHYADICCPWLATSPMSWKTICQQQSEEVYFSLKL